uniref:Cystatin domain-containing protein n=1 Tax=Oryzias latipes TaxID=8090 RepID=A0A3B3I2T6_ORYLA
MSEEHFLLLFLLCPVQQLSKQMKAEGLLCPTDINANDPEVQAALKFAMKEYNKGSSDQYLYVVVDVISVQGQVGNISLIRYNYFLSVKIAKTLCRKNSNVSGQYSTEFGENLVCYFIFVVFFGVICFFVAFTILRCCYSPFY